MNTSAEKFIGDTYRRRDRRVLRTLEQQERDMAKLRKAIQRAATQKTEAVKDEKLEKNKMEALKKLYLQYEKKHAELAEKYHPEKYQYCLQYLTEREALFDWFEKRIIKIFNSKK